MVMSTWATPGMASVVGVVCPGSSGLLQMCKCTRTARHGALKGCYLVQASDYQQLLLLVQLFSDIFMLALHHEGGGHCTACRDPVFPNSPVAPGSQPAETLMSSAGGANRAQITR